MNTLNIILGIILGAIVLFLIAGSMRSFTFTMPEIYIKQNIKYLLLSIFISLCLVYVIVRKIGFVFIVSVIILTYITYTIFTTMTTNDYIENAPDAVKPPPPHLGLDGISMSNIYTGL